MTLHARLQYDFKRSQINVNREKGNTFSGLLHCYVTVLSCEFIIRITQITNDVKNPLLMRKLTTSQSKNDIGVQGLVAFNRVFWTKLKKLKDGFTVFLSVKHQGQYLPYIVRPGTCSGAPQPAVFSPETIFASSFTS